MYKVFECKSIFECGVEKLFGFHENPVGFDTLVGLDPDVEVMQKPSSILEGSYAVLNVELFFGIKVKWIARHTVYKKNQLFVDEQEQGPFRFFRHEHHFREFKGNTILLDRVIYRFGLPFSSFIITPKLKKQFLARHEATARFLGVKYRILSCGSV
ncbi:MAG: hypothetical protein H7A25_07285 [Leptospiraceae bacterium]|nr:hypothetical protein [Leptospiraceae bacterium]MCP5499687.1 hypothetical protein [Leptospiraceae bacterium]